MRIVIALAAAAATLTATAGLAEAQSRKRERTAMVVQVKPRSYLDAGTQVQPGAYSNYSTGLTPFRSYDSIVPTGSPEQRLLPGRYGVAW